MGSNDEHPTMADTKMKKTTGDPAVEETGDEPQRATPAPGRQTCIAALREQYDGFLIDAYGVLLDKHQALPGAIALLESLTRDRIPWLIVTNAASRLPETLSAEFSALGLEVSPERILTSGGLLADAAITGGLNGLRAVVLGPDESTAYAERAGALVVPLADDSDADAVIIADQKGVRWPQHLDQTLSLILRRLDAGRPPRLLLCNPDLIYPVRAGRVGLTAGALAAMIEAVLQQQWPEAGLRFARLGKPSPALFTAAWRRLGSTRPVMLGDQLATDIAGAAAAGIDSALVGTGLATSRVGRSKQVQPTWHLPSLRGTA
jgi:HAD superfamily hydrolase (TIGR01450 family)